MIEQVLPAAAHRAERFGVPLRGFHGRWTVADGLLPAAVVVP